jgi:branched-chain amino acid transport system permease protein
MGPIVGAAVFHAVKDFFMPLTDAWRFCLGLSIIVMVVAFPRGLSGVGEALRGWRARRSTAIAPEAAA